VPDEPPEDVNQQVEQQWVEDTTPFERVRSVTRRAYEPLSAPDVADQARTSATTARKHLEQLADEGVLARESSADANGTLYRRSPSSLVLEEAAAIRRELDADALAERINEMKAELASLQDDLGVHSPEDAALAEETVDQAVLRDWRSTRRNLKLAQAALALERAEEAVEPA
jgi:predicted ArsR family transcriptional regulator